MGSVARLVCVCCGRDVEAPVSAGVCPTCPDDDAVLEVEYVGTLDPSALATRPRNIWRYRELLPVEPDATAIDWPVGLTPLFDTPRLAAWVGLARLRLKDDGRNPTGSFKDRASSIGVVHALQVGATRIACASTGNAASSLAGFAAMAGLPATIFVPHTAPEPKLAQLLIFGAEVRRVEGSYTEAYVQCWAECEEHGWYNRNCAINPYLVEGKKTCGLEIAEQTGDPPPDWVAVSVGDGCTIAGIGRGLREMQAIGIIGRVPRLLGVQAAGVDPIARAFATGTPPGRGDDRAMAGGETMADSIDVPWPRNWRKAVNEVRAADGAFVTVTDAEIGAAMRATGTRAGVFAEPAAAAAVAGVRRAVREGVIAPDADVVAVITGSGLKDVRSAMRVATDR